MSDRDILLSLIKGLCLADHLGDVANDIDLALRRMGLGHIKWDDLGELRQKLEEVVA
jgi:hypothetical protein